MDIFSRNLRLRAEQLGISNAEAARRAGLSETRYGNYVSGRREPDLALLVRIAEVLETTPNVLLGVDAQAGASISDKIHSAVRALDLADQEVIAACAEAIIRLRQR